MLERAAESKIQEAMAAGHLDDLPGAGKPLDAMLETPSDVWWMIRFNERRRLHEVISEMDVALEIEWKMGHILAMRDEAAARTQVELLNARIKEMNQQRVELGEVPISHVHVDSVMAQWRELHRPR